MTLFSVTHVFPEGIGHQRRVTGVLMSGPQAAATLANTAICEDLIHEDEFCGLRAVACCHLRPYLPREVREAYDAAQAEAAPPVWSHPEGLVWFRG